MSAPCSSPPCWRAWWIPGIRPWFWFCLGCGAILLAYVLRGWQLSETGARELLDLIGAPAFVIWKLLLVHSRQRSAEWVRTERKRS